MTSPSPIVVFSHLRWNFVFQRPQHLISRLAATRQVVFIEEPVHRPDSVPTIDVARPVPGLVVATPVLPQPTAGFDQRAIRQLNGLIGALLEAEEISDPVAWLYTPMALPLAEALDPSAIVYDCMDELSLFLGAPPDLVPMEAALLARADVVFTGGVSLYRAKRARHPNVHCFPSSVDAAHFRQARAGGGHVAEPIDQRRLGRPRLGFYGVLDERLDIPLLERLARESSWEIVLVGPIVKIEPAALPQSPNLHYMGQRSYEELPAYLAGWDVCLLPFARNDATRFISPTKTLEYMAAEKPIVSTPITDVAEAYRDVVYLADSPDEFAAACRRALAAPPGERADRTERMRAILGRTSWDATVAAMSDHVEAAAASRPTARRRFVAGA